MSEQRIDQPSKDCANACCGPPPLTPPSQATLFSERDGLIREAFRLEWVTIGWMTVEAAVALISGLAAGSLVLTAGESHLKKLEEMSGTCACGA